MVPTDFPETANMNSVEDARYMAHRRNDGHWSVLDRSTGGYAFHSTGCFERIGEPDARLIVEALNRRLDTATA